MYPMRKNLIKLSIKYITRNKYRDTRIYENKWQRNPQN